MEKQGGYSKGKTSGAYQFVLEDLLQNVWQYDWVYENLADETSKNVFTKLMQFRLIPDRRFLQEAYDGENPQYFDPAIVSCDADEVFVDCGGFTGDTVEQYVRQYGTYRKLYVYEPSSDNFKACRENLAAYPRLSQCGGSQVRGGRETGMDAHGCEQLLEQFYSGKQRSAPII